MPEKLVRGDGVIEWRDDEGRLDKWYRRGKRHCDDGPAAIYPDGRRIWFVDGVKVREERRPR